MNSIFGFPSPADDYLEHGLDLNQLLVQHPSATYFVKFDGDAMHSFGIFAEDILVIDRALPAVDGSIVMATIADEFLVRQLRIIKEAETKYILRASHNYPSIYLDHNLDVVIWGVVTYSLRNQRKHLDLDK